MNNAIFTNLTINRKKICCIPDILGKDQGVIHVLPVIKLLEKPNILLGKLWKSKQLSIPMY